MVTRPCGGWDDLPAMQAVCSATLRASPGRASAHPGDIAWWAAWPPQPEDRLADMFLLWEEGDGVVGFGARRPDDADLAIFVDPVHANTEEAIRFEDEVEAWAVSFGGPVNWSVFEDEAMVERWQHRGYRPVGNAYLNLVRQLADVRDAEADPRVRPVDDDDVDDRARITHDAFEKAEPMSDYLADYRRFRTSPAYPHGWDLMLRDPDGHPAACRIAWPDRVSGAATFEPVATHPSMHRRGYGAAVLREGFRRLAAAGMTYAIVGVETDNPAAEALYRSVGFHPDRVVRSYQRP